MISPPTRRRPLLAAAIFLTATTLLAGCSRSPAPTPEASPPPTDTQAEAGATAVSPTLPPETAVAFGQSTVRFEWPTMGAALVSPLEACLVAESLLIVPPGEVRPGTGHFVVLVDPSQEELLAIGAGTQAALASDESHVHLDDGGSCVTLDLAPGEHTLVVVVADGAEVPLSPPVMDLVVVSVAASGSEAPTAEATAESTAEAPTAAATP